MQIENLKVAFPMLHIETHVDLSAYTNTRVGGVADAVFWPESKTELTTVVKYAAENDLPVLVLGNASNLIITDEGVRGLVIFLTNLTEVTVTDQTITADAGAAIITVSEQAQQEGLTGLEWAAGIPGSVGGAVYMNAGAYGGQVDGCLATADVLHPDGTIETLTNEQLDFGYRHSAIQGTGDVIVSATFALVPGDSAKIRATMEDFNERRASKQPLEYPSCGSVFKRPEGHFAGKLIMDAGLQGFTIGGAQVSRKHAGFIVNFNDATSADYVGVIHHVQNVVFEQTGISLETEVRILGE